jgi:hypothetical protein
MTEIWSSAWARGFRTSRPSLPARAHRHATNCSLLNGRMHTASLAPKRDCFSVDTQVLTCERHGVVVGASVAAKVAAELASPLFDQVVSGHCPPPLLGVKSRKQSRGVRTDVGIVGFVHRDRSARSGRRSDRLVNVRGIRQCCSQHDTA